jgi:excisionase family DNA binding protein
MEDTFFTIEQAASILNCKRATVYQLLADGWLNPWEIATGEPGKPPTLPKGTTPQDAAAWTIVARVLLNLDETLTKP